MEAADLVIRLAAQTDQFEKGMQQAKSILATVGSTVATIAGAASIGVFAEKTIATAEAAGQLAARLGTTAESLTAMQYAAEMSDVEASKFNESMERMNRFLGTIGSSTTAQQTIAALGLNLKQVQAMSADEALLAISDGLTRIEEPAQRAALMTQLFGEGSMQMANMLYQGSDAIRQQMFEATRYGMTISSKHASMAASIGDSMKRVKFALLGAFQRTVLEVMPVIENFAEIVSKVTDVVAPWASTILKVVGGLLAVNLAIRVYNGLVKAYAVAQKLATAAAVAFQAIAAGPAGWVKLAAGIALATGAVIVANEAFDKATDGISSALVKQERLADAIGKTSSETVKLTSAQTEYNKAANDAFDKQFNTFFSSDPRIARLRMRPMDVTGEDPLAAYTDSSGDIVRKYYDDWKSKLEEVRDASVIPETPMQRYLRMVEAVNAANERGLIPLEKRNKMLADLDRKAEYDASVVMAEKMRAKRDELTRRADMIRDSVMTPVEEMRKKIREIKGLFSMGFLDATTFQRAVQAEFDKTKKQMAAGEAAAKQPEVHFAGAMRAGSTEAWGAVLSAMGKAAGAKLTEGDKVMSRKLDKLIEAVKDLKVEEVISIG